jgi:hypothetical protein
VVGRRAHRLGRDVVIAASLQRLAIAGFDMSPHWSSHSRSASSRRPRHDERTGSYAMWDQSIPDGLRGRMVGIEMLTRAI